MLNSVSDHKSHFLNFFLNYFLTTKQCNKYKDVNSNRSIEYLPHRIFNRKADFSIRQKQSDFALKCDFKFKFWLKIKINGTTYFYSLTLIIEGATGE